jgi:TM2 domain-containing membrane protein YozV
LLAYLWWVTSFGLSADGLARFYGAHPCKGILHGFLVWSLAVVIGLVVMASQAANSGTLGFSKLFVIKAQTALNQVPIENNNNQILNEPTQKAIHKIGLGSLSTFFIFLAGALGSCIGGYCGIKNIPDIQSSCGRSSLSRLS